MLFSTFSPLSKPGQAHLIQEAVRVTVPPLPRAFFQAKQLHRAATDTAFTDATSLSF